MFIINKRLFYTIILAMIGSLILAILGINPIFSIGLGLIFSILYTYIKTIYNDFCIVFFVIAFFFFLMSNEFVIEIFHLQGGLRESTEAANNHYLVVLVLSLVGLLIGYQIIFRKQQTDLRDVSLETTEKTYRYRQVSKILFYLTFLLYLAPVIERIIFVRNYSYYLSYVSYSSNIPVIIVKIGEMCPVFFSVYLATFPSKKECKFPIILYVIYASCYLLTGKRYQTVASYLFIVVYYLIRNKTDEKIGNRWIKGRTIVIILFALPLVCAGLAAYSTIRNGNSLESGTSFGDLIYTLFTSVADSDKVIKYGYILKDKFPSGHFYSLGNVIDYCKYSKLSKVLFGSNITVSQTAEYALYGNGYSYTLSYLYYPVMFLSGHGLGSCYIAELYQDMGYLGVFGGNILLGIIIRNVFTLSKFSVFRNAIIFYMFKLLMLTPRNDYDVILRELCSFSFLCTLAILGIAIGILTRKQVKQGK